MVCHCTPKCKKKKKKRHETVATYGVRHTEVAEESQITDQDMLVH